MSIQVNDFRWEPGKNDAEYIKLLESSRDEWQKIAQKAITKLKTLSKAPEPMVMTLEEVEDAIDTVVWVDRPTVKNESELFGLIQTYSRKFTFVQIKHIGMNMGEHMLYPYETYGKEWRCWTSRPDEKRREETPWN